MSVERIGLPIRIQGALDYLGGGRWRLWLHTRDYVLGTYLELYGDGKVVRVTEREGEGPDIVLVRPAS